MAYGLTCYNDTTGELTMSDSGSTYSYIGIASRVSITQAGAGASITSGRSVYTIDWPGDIIVAIPLVEGRAATLRSTVRSGNTWTITVMYSLGSTDSNGFTNQDWTNVYVFGAATVPSGWGIAIYDDLGNICADLTRPPLTYTARISSDGSSAYPIPPGIVSPAIIGYGSGYRTTSTGPIAGGLWQNSIYVSAWSLISGYLNLSNFKTRQDNDDIRITVVNIIRPANALLVDLSKLVY